MNGQSEIIRVLLIEDNEDDALIIREILAQARGAPFDLEWADRLATGLARLAKGGIDVVLTDLGLPDSQGLDTCTTVHAQAPDVPIVVLTGLVDEVLGVKAVQAGAQDYLVKGQIDSNLLVRTMRYAIERQRSWALEQQTRDLQASEARLRTILDNNADGIVIVDRNGIVRFVNPAVEALFGRKAHELLGESFGFPVVAGEVAELDILRSDGETAIAEMRVVEIEWEGELPYLASLHDITERKRAEEEIRRHLERIEALREIDRAITSTLDLTEVLDVILRELERVIPYNSAGIFLLSDGVARLTAGRGFPDMEVALQISFPVVEDALTCDLLQEKRPLVLADAQADERFLGRGGTDYVRSWIGVPLITKEKAVGFLTIDHREPGVYDEESADMAQAFASQVAIAIENARLFEETKRLHALNEGVVQGVAEAILMEDAEGIFTFANPAAEKLLGYTREELIGRHWSTIVAETEMETVQQETAKRPQGIESHYEMALLSKEGRVIPVIVSARPMFKDGKFAGVLSAITDITERKRAEEEIRRRSAVLQAINEVFQESLTCETDEEVARTCLAVAEELTGSRFGFIGELNQAGLFDTIAISNPGWDACKMPHSDATRLITGMEIRGIYGSTLREGKSRIVNDSTSHPDRVGTPEGHPPITCFLGVPLKQAGRPIGMIGLSNKEGGYDLADQQAIEALSVAFVEALHRKRAEERVQRQLQRLNALHDIDMAITASVDLRLTLRVILEQIITRLNVDAADVLLLNPHTQTLEYAAGRGFSSRALQHTNLRLGEGYAGHAALERRMVSIPNIAEAEDDLRCSPLLPGEEFIAYYGVPLIAKGQVKGVLEIFHRAPLEPDPEWMEFLEMLAGQAAIAIDNAALFDDLQRSNIELTLAYDITLEGWARALELRDYETEGHARRVVEMTLRLARTMGMSEEELIHVRRGTLLHDIGKIGVPDSILLKPGPLTEEEWEIMRQHPVYAYEMLSPIAYLRPALDIPYCHHEKWDGTGYPRGLKGEQIPLTARIFAVVDVWDALLSDRPYRAAWSEEQAIEYIREQAGKHFDPQVVEVFMKLGEL